MNTWLKGNMFGMPRWLWLSLLAAGVVGGLYLRNKNKNAAAAATNPTDPNAIDPTTGLPYSSQTQAYDPSLDPSLAGLGAYPSGGGSDAGGYQNSYAEDLLSQMLSQQSGSGQTAQDLQDFIDQQNQYDQDLQSAIAANDQGLQAAIKQQQKQTQKQIAALKKKIGKGGAKKPKKRKADVAVGAHGGSGQKGRRVSSHPVQGYHDTRNQHNGRTRKNTPTGGGPPARPPHAHMPVHKKSKR